MRNIKSSVFVITNDHLEGTSLSKEKVKELKKEGYTDYFKLYDDDDTLYYSGYMKSDIDDEFAPLNWAMYDSGCTYMKTRDKSGKMTVL